MLWAKSADSLGVRQTLLDHSISVIEMARRLFDRLPPSVAFDENLRSDLEVAAAVHDIGKAAIGFQAMLIGESKGWHGRRHEVLSAAFAAVISQPVDVVFAVLTHHKRIPDSPPFVEPRSRLRFDDSEPEDWDATLLEFEANRAEINKLWTEIADYLRRHDLTTNSGTPLTGNFMPSRWRRSDKQRKGVPADQRRRASLIRGLLVSADHLSSGGATLPEHVHLNTFIPRFELRSFQERAAIPGNVILRAPTGSGKTEAALKWAAVNQPANGRFFYTLPYTAALNAMHRRLQSLFPERADSIGLLHGRAAHHLFAAFQEDFPTDPAGVTAEAKARASLAKEMYHPIRVCTPHQLLRYTLKGKGWEQILTEIPGACIVFDEVHSYDPALAGLTLGTARLFHRLGASVMFISATLPRFLERIIAGLLPCTVVVPRPDCEGDKEIMEQRRHRIRVVENSLRGLLPSITEDARAGATVLVVCNHVNSAQTMARLLREELGRDEVTLFHSRFNMRDRGEIEKKVSQMKLPRVLVATQVVEVSLDISYDAGYFEAAPIDALAQRMGRVNRLGGPVPAFINIATQPLNPHPIYDSERTQQTLVLLRRFSEAISERDIVEVCDTVYGDGYEGEDLQTFKDRLDHRYLADFEGSIVAGDHENWIDTVIEGLDNRIEVLPTSLHGEYRQLRAERRWLEADALFVSIRRNKKVITEYVTYAGDVAIIDLPYTSDGLQFPTKKTVPY